MFQTPASLEQVEPPTNQLPSGRAGDVSQWGSDHRHLPLDDCRGQSPPHHLLQPAQGVIASGAWWFLKGFLSELSSLTWGERSGFSASGRLWVDFLKEKRVWEEIPPPPPPWSLAAPSDMPEPQGEWPDAEPGLLAETKHPPQPQTWLSAGTSVNRWTRMLSWPHDMQ